MKLAAGAWPDIQSACNACIRITGSTSPDPLQVETYQKSYQVFQQLYPNLRNDFVQMANIA